MVKRSGGKSDKAVLSEMPMRFGDDPLLWAAWLYYEDGMTQADIANLMGLSRASVNTYLADARTRGLVNIEIEPDRFRFSSIFLSVLAIKLSSNLPR